MTFTYGNFIFEVLNGICSLKSPVAGKGYTGAAIIPNVAKNGSKRYIVTKISNECFKDCVSLNAISFPDTLKTIGSNVIYNTSVTSLFIPKSVKLLGNASFSGVYLLETVIFEPGSKLETIGNTAFAWCTKLTSIVFPPSVKSIEGHIFQGFSEITVYYCSKNAIQKANAFESSGKDVSVTLYVPAGYPSRTEISKFNPTTINDDVCKPYNEVFNNRVTCKATRKAMGRFIFIYALIVSL